MVRSLIDVLYKFATDERCDRVEIVRPQEMLSMRRSAPKPPTYCFHFVHQEESLIIVKPVIPLNKFVLIALYIFLHSSLIQE